MVQLITLLEAEPATKLIIVPNAVAIVTNVANSASLNAHTRFRSTNRGVYACIYMFWHKFNQLHTYCHVLVCLSTANSTDLLISRLNQLIDQQPALYNRFIPHACGLSAECVNRGCLTECEPGSTSFCF